MATAALAATWTVGQVLGPALAGLLIGQGHGHLWAITVVGGTAVAALLFLGLRHRLTPEQGGVTDSDHAQKPHD